MIKRIIYPVLCAAICFTSCKKTTENVDPVTGKPTAGTGATGTQNPGSGNTPTGGTVNTNIDNAAMLKMVNNVRAAGCTCGTTVMPPVAPLTWNDILATSALSHSNDMAKTGILDHNSSDGTSFSDRITAAGYVWSTVGENIAEGQTTEQQVFNDWMQSEGHCKNIMNGNFKDFGAARSGVFWTQDFGAKR